MRELVRRYTLAFVALAMLCPGCGPGDKGNSRLDVARYALAHRSIPVELLKRGGISHRYEKMPFICGTATLDASRRIEKAAADLPPEVGKALLEDWKKELAGIPPPDPEYVVDLTRVAEVRVGWFGGQCIAIIRHPVTLGRLACGREHPTPTDRVFVTGNFLSGPGPVTIWSGDRLLGFTDEPWILIDAGQQRAPWLVTLSDCRHICGSVFIGIRVPLGKGGEVNRQCELPFVEQDDTGYELLLPAPGFLGGPRVDIMRWSGGRRTPYARITLEGADGDLSFLRFQTTTMPGRDEQGSE
jgi:hypothetical protein